jgi:atypical dual specificity phosphatase
MLGITEVIDNLYISGLESRQAIINKGIRCVINISSECPTQDLGPTVEYEKVSILDLPTTSIQPYFDRLTDRIHQNLQQGKKTLVHCYVGRSRSATIILGKSKCIHQKSDQIIFIFVLAYLMKYKQMSLREAFHYLRARRHIVGPNFGFIKQVLLNHSRLILHPFSFS